MSDIEENDCASVRLFGKNQDNDNDKTALIIPKQFAKVLDIGKLQGVNVIAR